MGEVALLDPYVAVFDGRVFELFGPYSNGGTTLPSVRVLARHLVAKTEGPDKKGHYTLSFQFLEPRKYTFTARFTYEDVAAWLALTPFLDELRAAGVEFGA